MSKTYHSGKRKGKKGRDIRAKRRAKFAAQHQALEPTARPKQ